MEIGSRQPIQNTTPVSGKRKPSNSVEVTEGEHFAGAFNAALFTAIEDALASLPEVRESFLEEGQRLVDDPNYPNPQETEEICQLLMRNFLKDPKNDDPQQSNRD